VMIEVEGQKVLAHPGCQTWLVAWIVLCCFNKMQSRREQSRKEPGHPHPHPWSLPHIAVRPRPPTLHYKDQALKEKVGHMSSVGQSGAFESQYNGIFLRRYTFRRKMHPRCSMSPLGTSCPGHANPSATCEKNLGCLHITGYQFR
jgi:hypothetical protein